MPNYSPAELTRLGVYLLAALGGLILLIFGAARADMTLIGIGLPLLGYGLPAANVNKTEPVPEIDITEVADDA